MSRRREPVETAKGEEGAGGARLAVLREMIIRHTPTEGVTETPVPGLCLYRTTRRRPREPMVFGASVCVVAAGVKRAYAGRDTFSYDPLNYLVLSVPLPIDCEIIEASPADPFLSLVVDLDPARVSQLALEIEAQDAPVEREAAIGIYTARVDDPLLDAMVRLVGLLDNARDITVLGPLIEREILYRLLMADRRGLLRAAGLPDSRVHRLSRILQFVQSNLASPLDVPTLARRANMSLSTFYHHFRTVTGQSPLQYLKVLRLHQARSLMLHQGLSPKEASRRVGYRSTPQFTRDYHRAFGAPPVAEISGLLLQTR